MKLETQFNVGDKIWLIHDAKICGESIDGIDVNVDEENIITVYYIIRGYSILNGKDFGVTFFNSKQDLVDHLLKS